MSIVRNICLHTIGGALLGGGLTTLAKLSTTAQEQRYGALIGATSACARALLQPVIAEVGAKYTADARKIAVVDVAAQVVVSGVALAAFHFAELLNAPTIALFGLVASLQPIVLLSDL